MIGALLLVALGAAPEPLPVIALPPTKGATATVKLAFRAGSIDDPLGRAGLTALCAEWMARGGTRELGAEKLQEELYERGASIDVQADREQVVFTARAPAASIVEVSHWMAEEVAAPTLDEGDFGSARAEALDGLEQLVQGSNEALAAEALMPALFPQHPYGRPASGTSAGLSAATIDEARAQLGRVFTRDRLTIGLSGAYPEGLATQLDTALATLPVHGVAVGALPPAAPGPRALLVARRTGSTTFFLGMPWDVKRGDPDFVPLAVGISALGEHRQFGGRLFGELRDLRGLNYGDYAYVERFVQDGASTFPAPHVALRQQYFSLWVRPVDRENRVFALRAAMHVVREMVERGITEGELQRTRNFLAGATRLWAQTDERELGWAIDGAFYGDPQFLAHYRDALGSVTVAQVNAALKRHLDPSKLRIVAVGPDAEGLARTLRSGEPSAPRYAGVPPRGAEEADRRIAGLDLGLRPEDVEVVEASALFAK
ncbi:MAG: insulinase family protein [Deltaproteobacteria bacterium]|nr:insulinase family protein [Deltaproteobacteria bacterium]